jgi:hypothetical protein
MGLRYWVVLTFCRDWSRIIVLGFRLDRAQLAGLVMMLLDHPSWNMPGSSMTKSRGLPVDGKLLCLEEGP